MRARNLKPEFFRDRKMGQTGPMVALIYQALWCLADDHGTAPCDPIQVKGEMFVYWPMIGVPEITGALRHLDGTGRVKLFMVGDQLFARIPSWKKHQHPHKPSKFKHPVTGDAVTWDGDIPVPHHAGTEPAPPTSLEPRAYTQSNSSSTPSYVLTDGECAFLAALPDEKRPRWEMQFRNWRQGLGTPGMRPFTDDDISVGLIEYLTKVDNPDFSPQHVVTFPERARARREQAPREHTARRGGGKSALEIVNDQIEKEGAA